MEEPTVRQARHEDHEALVGFADEIWPERDERDYLPDVFHEWVLADGERQRTVVVEVDDTAAGVCQARLLSDHEAWLQGMRVDPAHRQGGLGLAMVEALFEWARDQGASVARNLVYSWNEAGLGQSIAAGFEPRTAFRWAEPAPGADAPAEADATAAEAADVPAGAVVDDPAAAWSCWARSEARDALAGLALDPEVTWAVSESTGERLRTLADEERVLAVVEGGTRAATARVRTTERAVEGDSGSGDGEETTETLVEYGFTTWDDQDAARALFSAIRADAHEQGADATRVLLPETPRHVAQAASVRAGIGEYPFFILETDLTGAD